MVGTVIESAVPFQLWLQGEGWVLSTLATSHRRFLTVPGCKIVASENGAITMLHNKRYKATLSRFMSFKDKRHYDWTTSFSVEQLLAVTPDDVCDWMNTRAYGAAVPTEDMKPIFTRSTTLEFAKKAISCFMPRRNALWDPIRQEGNPTRSDPVNRLIKTIKRFEVRKEGVPSKAGRHIEYEEFLPLISLIHSNESMQSSQYLLLSVLPMQWHLIARIDDMMKLKFENIHFNHQYPGTLLCQMRWSKNISEEREAPVQIIVGSMDPKLCPLLNLAVFIEHSVNVISSPFVYGNPSVGDRVVRRFLQKCFNSDSFHRLEDGNLGTHSLRKGAATYAGRAGVPKDYINRRGRWRTRKAIVDVYIDNTLPYPDACVAAALAGPCGPFFFVVKDGIGCVTASFLVDCIATSIKHVMGEAIAKTLALPLLWAALEPETSYEFQLLPTSMRQRIVSAFVRIGGNPEVNPVRRVGFHVSGNGAQLQLIELVGDDGSDRDQSPTSRLSNRRTVDSVTQKEFAALQSQMFGLKRDVGNVINEVLRSRQDTHRDLQRIALSVRRIALQPVARPGHQSLAISTNDEPSEDSHRTHQRTARLSKRPQDRFALWHEYEFGCAGQKPAKDFTARERGSNKYAYSRRKPLWDVVSNLVRAGFTSDAAIDKVYAVYGRRLPVSSILQALRVDRRNGGHPALRVKCSMQSQLFDRLLKCSMSNIHVLQLTP